MSILSKEDGRHTGGACDRPSRVCTDSAVCQAKSLLYAGESLAASGRNVTVFRWITRAWGGESPKTPQTGLEFGQSDSRGPPPVTGEPLMARVDACKSWQ